MAAVTPLPQRVSAHVVPKSHSDDDERTTIDPQWYDGVSALEKRNGSRKPGAPPIGAPPPTQPLADANVVNPWVPATQMHTGGASLFVTKGPDRGLSFEIQPGKAFTVGRSLDSDVVLTDIAVSRKHFDLRSEDGWWVISDRGSGNGTLVNGDLRNNPFRLASGDLIEVGTTVIRFSCEATDAASEVSTIAGKIPPGPEPDPAPISAHSELVAATPDPPHAQMGPGVLRQLADSRIPLLPTRPLALGPHSPTLLGVEAHELAMRLPAPRPAIAPIQAVAPAPAPPVQAISPSPRRTSRFKYILGSASVATLIAVVAVGVASTRLRSTVPTEVSAPPPPRSKFSLPVSELSEPSARANAGQTTSIISASRSIATPAEKSRAPAVAQPVATKAAVPNAENHSTPGSGTVTSSANADAAVEVIVAKKTKAARPKTAKKSPTKRTTGGGTAEDVETKADALYRAGKFNEAADVLRAFARSADRTTKRSFDGKASSYASFGKAYNNSMANNNAIAAFTYLRSATNYDQSLGGAFEDEIAERMKQIAPKAAVAYMAADRPTDAYIAVDAAEQAGASSDSNVAVVRQKLESAAAKLYADAMKDLPDNPSEAREKFRQIKTIVDSESPWYGKAVSQLQAK